MVRSRSSTSSSEVPSNSEQIFAVGRAPWAFVIALSVLVMVELGLRAMPPQEVIPYERTGRVAYSAVRHYLRARGPADISIVGSSRTREGINSPLLRQLIDASLGDDVRVANYASPAASSDESAAIVRLMLREGGPRMILYGVSPLQLSVIATEQRHAGELWFLEDWLRERERTGRTNERVYREVIQNEIERYYWTFAYRQKFWLQIKTWTGGSEPSPSPINGDLSHDVFFDPGTSLLTRPIAPRRVKEYIGRRMRGRRYPMGGKATEFLESLVQQCQEAEVELVLFELPMSDILTEHFPDGAIQQFRRIVQRTALEHNVPFVRRRDMRQAYSDGDFREQSHLNLVGSEKLTTRLAELVVIPYLGDGTIWENRFGRSRDDEPLPDPPEAAGQ